MLWSKSFNIAFEKESVCYFNWTCVQHAKHKTKFRYFHWISQYEGIRTIWSSKNLIPQIGSQKIHCVHWITLPYSFKLQTGTCQSLNVYLRSWGCHQIHRKQLFSTIQSRMLLITHIYSLALPGHQFPTTSTRCADRHNIINAQRHPKPHITHKKSPTTPNNPYDSPAWITTSKHTTLMTLPSNNMSSTTKSDSPTDSFRKIKIRTTGEPCSANLSGLPTTPP